MTQRHWFAWCLQLGWVGLLGWIGAIACATSTLAQSRIVPDNTLGAQSSIVIPNVQGLPIEAITGGAIRGANLFHSFREFNVDAGRAAYFQNPNANIKNIFTRVTGNNRSDIFGTLGTIGNAANLFLINPNGIVFGPNAALNVGGSFVGTTANAIQFGNLGIFSASTPEAPSPLLTINPSALLFNQLSPASITYDVRLNPVSAVTGLRVPDGQSLLLVGGDINVNGGSLRAPQGRIELAGLAAPGTVGLNLADNTLSLNVPVGVARANVSLSNGAEINVRGANGGSIVINAHDLNLAGASILRAGIASGLGTPNSQAGDIEINATGDTTLSDGSFIANAVQSQAIGKGGNTNITTGSLSLSNGASLSNSTFGQGDAGRVFVQASKAVSLVNSSILNDVEAGAVGNTNGIFITAESLSLTDGAYLESSIFGANASALGGRGNPGGVNINVSDRVTFAGVNQNRSFSGIYNNTAPGSVGNGGDINISARSLSLTDGAFLNTSNAGQGNGGNITINARDTVEFDGIGVYSIGGLQSDIRPGGVGKGGDIRVTTGSLSLTNGSVLFAGNAGQGNAGNITISARDTITFDGTRSIASTEIEKDTVGSGGDIRVNARALFLKNGGQLNANNFGQGNAGSIIINASDTIAFDGVGITLESSANSFAVNGNGGDIRLTTGTLSLTNGGNLSSFAQGDAGSITINTRDAVRFDGVGSDGVFSGINNSRLPNVISSGNLGNTANIFVTTGTLTVSNGAKLFSSSYGQSNGGNITINARDAIKFDGVDSNQNSSGAYSTVELASVGQAGNINLTTGSLSLNNGAQVSASTSSFGNGGNITINANTFEALNGGQVTTSTAGTGKAGTINLNLKDSLTLAGSNVNFTSQRFSGIFANTDPNSTGDGGSIFIDPRQATIRDGARISVNSAGTGNAGNINLFAGTLTLDNGGLISAQTVSSQGGNINLPLGNILLLRRGSSISTNAGIAQARGDGGNININAPFIVAVPDENSDITANAYSGRGGRVQINAQGVIGIQNRSQQTPESDITASSTLGVQGVVNIFIPDPNILRDNLTQLPENIIDANTLVANSCIARRHNQSGGTFFVVGNGGLPERPGEATLSRYSTGTIRTIPNGGEKATLPSSTNSVRPWKNGDPIIAAQGIYRLANGDLVLGRECPLADSY
ncbi:MAG: filamentous hemagglutinin N-terminal domain-containing protein [Rhizonema sp. NSF051]|nr:filamentous hemagglutinin N-terminal domain-containing protein [Rhizonema sp. NSF051]